MSLPLGDLITRDRALKVIDLVCLVCILTALVCLTIAATATFTWQASLVVGTVLMLAWLGAGALWLWYT